MEQEKPRPEPPSGPKSSSPRDDVRVAANRCPLCHEDARPSPEAP